MLDFEDNLEQLTEQWVMEYGDMIVRTAYQLVNDVQLAQDVAQEVFIRAYKGYKNFRKDANVRTWLVRITINAAKDMRRTNWFKRVSPRAKADETIPDNADDALEAAVINSAERDALLGALRKIPFKYAQTLILYYYNDLSTAEIAEVCKCSAGTVTSRLKRGRDVLRAKLGKDFEKGKTDSDRGE